MMRANAFNLIWICIVATLFVVAPARGGDPAPQVVRLRVPSDGVKGIFPAGTELRVLPRDEFEALVEAATAGALRLDVRPNGSRLLRARHEARLEGDRLVGRTEVGFEPGGLVSMDPWSPAIGDLDPALGRLLVGADGRLSLKPAKVEVVSAHLPWVQACDPGSKGRTFALGLPSAASSRLTLDLPEGVVPEVAGSIRQGPAPAASPDRRTWRLDTPPGPWRLRLRWPRASDDPADPVWIGGSTRIDMSQVPARWSLSAIVDAGPAGPSRIGLRLDPGLELLEVSGPGVASFRQEPAEGGGTNVIFRLTDSATGPTPVTIRAFTAGPTEDGAWLIPSYRPIDAVFTGGRTLVRLGPGEAVVASQEKSSRQVEPTTADREFGSTRTGLLLVYESSAAGSPAVLSVRRTSADARADVRGTVTLGPRGSRSLDARLTWNVDRGRLLYLSADLPPGWTPESARVRDQSEATAWHVESRPGGGSRIVVRPSSSNGGRSTIVLDVTATSRVPAEAQVLELPRVTPVGVRVVDEVWSLRAEPGMSVSPTRARGLAWLDPSTLDPLGLAGPPPGTPPAIMAWRWSAADGQASLDLGRDTTSAGIDAWTSARFLGNRLQLDYLLVLAGAGAAATGPVVVFSASGSDFPSRWDVLGQAARPVEVTAISAAEIQALGLPRSVSAWQIGVTRGEGERLVLHARVERAWTGSGSPPLLQVAGGRSRGGTLLIASDRDHGLTCEATGLTPLDPEWASASFRESTGEVSASTPLPKRLSLAFSYAVSTPYPLVRTTWLPPAANGGIIEEARLVSIPSALGQTLHRLSLRIVAGPDRKIEVRLPTGMILDRAEIDGKPALVLSVDGALRFSLPEPIPSQPTSDLELIYLGAANRGNGVVHADRPVLSLPCLAFSWGVELAPAQEIDHVTGGLVGPGPTNSKTLGVPLSLSMLDERVRRFSPEGLTLGGWLARLDGGGTPIVVDRGSLAGTGWGPRTPLVPRRSRLAGRSAEATFADLGLTLSNRGGIAVVSAGPAAVGVDDAILAAYEGQGTIDRVQSVPRWRGEPTPGSGTEGSTRPDAPAPGSSNIHMFAASGWPGDDAAVQVSDYRARWILMSVVAAILGLIALITCRSSWVRRSIVAVVVVASGAVAAVGLVPCPAGLGSGLLLGACVAAGVWFGAAIGLKREPRSIHSRSGRTRVVGAIAGMFALIATGFVQAGPDEAKSDEPIVALLPYELPFDPAAPAGSVIIRLSDHDRLRALADLQPPQSARVASLTGSLHEVRREGAADARVASGFDLWLEGPGPVAWPVPIGAARDLSAKLDGHDVPIRLGPTATVEITGEGAHRLILRRLVAIERTVEGETLQLRIPPIATARLRVVESAENPNVETINARGRTSRADGLLSADLGPVANLELRWPGPKPKGPRPRRGSVQAQILWDIEPAGDRVRIHVTPNPPESLDHLVLNLGSGLRVRSVDRTGIEGITTATPDGTTWVLPLEAPLVPGQTLSLELWRPEADLARPGARRLPRIDFANLADVALQVGVRRPADWQGRINPGEGVDIMADDVFVKAWGMLPDTGATFAGAAKLLDSATLAVPIGPSKERPRVRPSVQIELVPGRLGVRASFEILDEASRPREWMFVIPPDLRLVRVEAPGLTDWRKVGTDRLRIRFDGETPITGSVIRISGTVPVEEDPLSQEPAESEAAIPWPSPLDTQVTPGSLTINAAARLDSAPGVSPVSEIPKPAQSTFAVAPGAVPGRLRWKTVRPGLGVRVQGMVTLHPGTADWVASARYSIPYGPCPPIGLRLPSTWAEGAIVEVGGVVVTPEVAVNGLITTWTLRPKRIPWGGVRVVVRSSRARPAGAALEFPDLVPLGRPVVDRVDSLLGLSDTLGRLTAVEGSAGLQEVDATRWDAGDLPWPPASGRRVYRVLREGWTLNLLAPTSNRELAGEAVVRLADLTCTFVADGGLIGRASYDLDGRRASSLVIALPPGAEALATDVDGTPVVPRLGGSGQVIVPLPEGVANRVVFCWKAEPTPLEVSGRHTLALPRVLGERIPTLLSISGRNDAEFVAVGETVACLMVDLEATRVEGEANVVVEQIATLDRGSPRESANLLASLIRFELQARTVERTARGPDVYGTPRASEALGRLATSRANLQDALATTGLDAFGRSAAARVGRDTREPLPGQSATVESPAPLRVRPIGRVRFFRDDSGRPSLQWSPRQVSRSDAWKRDSSLTAVGLALLTLPFAGRRARVSTLGLAAVVALSAWILGVGAATILAALATGVVVGWFAQRWRPRIDPGRSGD